MCRNLTQHRVLRCGTLNVECWRRAAPCPQDARSKRSAWKTLILRVNIFLSGDQLMQSTFWCVIHLPTWSLPGVSQRAVLCARDEPDWQHSGVGIDSSQPDTGGCGGSHKSQHYCANDISCQTGRGSLIVGNQQVILTAGGNDKTSQSLFKLRDALEQTPTSSFFI